MKEKIKEIAAQILYLSGPEEIDESASLFSDLNLSSIDYVDLCYELKDKVSDKVTLDNLWPFNRMLLDAQYHTGSEWTDKGWEQVCALMRWDGSQRKCELRELYDQFSVSFIERRIAELA